MSGTKIPNGLAKPSGLAGLDRFKEPASSPDKTLSEKSQLKRSQTEKPVNPEKSNVIKEPNSPKVRGEKILLASETGNLGKNQPKKVVLGNTQNKQMLEKISLQETQNPPMKITAEAPGGQMVSAGDLFMNTAAALGYPKDQLSTALLAFLRFFSLSPALLGKLRQETLASLKTASSGRSKEKAAIESKALAASAAMDKGVILSPAALEHYAHYFIPPVPASDSHLSDRGKNPAAEELREIAEEDAGNDALLSFLNKLPGKNGQKWLVYPFSIKVKGIELNVFLRILKRECDTVSSRLSPWEEDYLIADISGPKRHWRCFVRRTAGKLRGDIRVYPELPDRVLRLLSKQAESYLGAADGFEEILVQNGVELPSWVEDLYTEPLPLINKEV